VVAEIQGLRLLEVTDREQLKRWNELMIGEHPLHDARMVGRLRATASNPPNLSDLKSTAGRTL